MSVIFVIILFLFILVIYRFKINKYEYFENNLKQTNKIPKIVVSTYNNKSKIPEKVYKNIKKYAGNYTFIIFNDKEAIDFIKKNYSNKYVKIFKSFKCGAHKADFFRYCYLYKKGGVYIDIKTELIKKLDDIFNKENTHLYTVLSINKHTIYQGIIATIPNNPLFLYLVKFMVNIQTSSPNNYDYIVFTKDFYFKLFKYYKNIKMGYNKDFYNKYNLYLFMEKCSNQQKECKTGLDKYGLCCYVYDNNKKIIKTRYADYPWI